MVARKYPAWLLAILKVTFLRHQECNKPNLQLSENRFGPLIFFVEVCHAVDCGGWLTRHKIIIIITDSYRCAHSFLSFAADSVDYLLSSALDAPLLWRFTQIQSACSCRVLWNNNNNNNFLIYYSWYIFEMREWNHWV